MGFFARQRVLLICGSLNQTTMMHQVARCLPHHDCIFTPFYATGVLQWMAQRGWLDFTVMGPKGAFRGLTDQYLADHHLPVDEGGQRGRYDLVVTCSDLVIQSNIRRRPIVLIQEGMTDPANFAFHLVRRLGLPRWLASTSTTGLSLAYRRFCVASEGYRDFFIQNGVPADRIVVTGIPNFDNCQAYLANDLPLRDYVLVATSDTRETFKRDDRQQFFDWVQAIARGRPLVFKLHPNENVFRSSAEIRERFPAAKIIANGPTGQLIANCQALVTQYSSVVYIGLALGKECHSYFDPEQLRRLLPLQNGGASAANIAQVCDELLGTRAPRPARRFVGAA